MEQNNSDKIKVNGTYFVAQCEICGFKDSSEKWLGGHQIADTGDYGDVYCPVCGHIDCEEAEDDLYIDQRELFLQRIAQLNNLLSESNWNIYEISVAVSEIREPIHMAWKILDNTGFGVP